MEFKQQITDSFREIEKAMRAYEEMMKSYVETRDKDEVRTIFKKAKEAYANVIDLRIRGLKCCIYLSDIPECEIAMDSIRERLATMRHLKHSI